MFFSLIRAEQSRTHPLFTSHSDQTAVEAAHEWHSEEELRNVRSDAFRRDDCLDTFYRPTSPVHNALRITYDEDTFYRPTRPSYGNTDVDYEVSSSDEIEFPYDPTRPVSNPPCFLCGHVRGYDPECSQ